MLVSAMWLQVDEQISLGCRLFLTPENRQHVGEFNSILDRCRR